MILRHRKFLNIKITWLFLPLLSPMRGEKRAGEMREVEEDSIF
jgi:hypothetical protein